jgi:hypothetical protein
VGSDTRQNEPLVQLGNCHPLSCGEGLIIRNDPSAWELPSFELHRVVDHETNSSDTDPSEGWCAYSWKVVTWLILPVVICLSQRLSHACLSINKFVL